MFERIEPQMADAHPSPSSRKPTTELFLISALILFLELACIRWFPANVLFLTFFTNTVLLACFLGMSLGCLAASHRRNYLKATPVLLAFALFAASQVEIRQSRLGGVVDIGQNSPQVVFFGTEFDPGNDVAKFAIPVEALAGFFFLAIALSLVGPGQELGRALARVPNRIQAYTVNILGSIAGIVLFALGSFLELSPGWWFLSVGIGLAYFLFERPVTFRQSANGVVLALCVLLSFATTIKSLNHPDRQEYWSPYYRVSYDRSDRSITVNMLGHQQMFSRETNFLGYALPYLLNRDTGGTPPQDVLIIGAGSGNDVSRALQWGAKHIDAVEIDPRIQSLGKQHHPDQPYSETDRVTVHLGDGRNFLRSTDRKYDLVIYALVDSLVLHSSYSNIRLESYLFTKEAFDDVKNCLKPDGMFVMYNGFRRGWIVSRLEKTLIASFDEAPLVFTVPYRANVDAESVASGSTMLISGSASALQPLRKAFRWSDSNATSEPVLYWMDSKRAPDLNTPNGFAQRPPEDDASWMQFGLARVEQPADLNIATDDWPHLYLRKPLIPDMSLRGAAMMGGAALILLIWFLPRRSPQDKTWGDEFRAVSRYWTNREAGNGRSRFIDARMFFLGAGFMLIETKAVVHMALLFGSTWMVNSVVFFAVLVMILAANVFVRAARPKTLWPYYLGLFASLILNAVIPLDSFLGWGHGARVAGSCLLVFAPILFAAVIFAVSFSRTPEADRAFGFNIAGAMLGGLAEYSSMLIGFRNLEFVALAFYVFSTWNNNSLMMTVESEHSTKSAAGKELAAV